MKTITLTPANDRLVSYGVTFQSTTLHQVIGKGVHNPHFNHELRIWKNSGKVDPNGRSTDQETSLLLTAQSTTITAWKEAPLSYGPTLTIGERVVLLYPNGEASVAEVQARHLADPELILV